MNQTLQWTSSKYFLSFNSKTNRREDQMDAACFNNVGSEQRSEGDGSEHSSSRSGVGGGMFEYFGWVYHLGLNKLGMSIVTSGFSSSGASMWRCTSVILTRTPALDPSGGVLLGHTDGRGARAPKSPAWRQGWGYLCSTVLQSIG
ncbi:protein ENHANCED DISEASE RESISTANCE 2-like isoform X1 [Prunus yedoensis var. nudiflora]|uniref:Protein ENHANCED DISEASE RESISTANCE 2-like isoform X1 n=1 Tax=Prunus yedoensis var. nudiflora TaxID=2094558 RepID=A0A314U821_PRUYE|nr:protein ENHANCED DISEASE RESISTANCE 2-like isoform X1 [Prunus yedoensis var. nudiflora]